ncbi:hypothetical protein FB567DRAFT_608351 [Paraphoma chrysanthemicola]|uniref:Uncharacterized protein n=1 Tax=Paraphoma chrysanthemicola TaxID=798071 RepID=A0A8K0VV84_9PLEO|nr:hypothetical protein FB567DRAFT_608351 [Paraphoma chrysanthemicola]
MKVVEKETDRRAEVHIYVEGKVEPLAEYGEYVDSKDKAVCCYVPVVEGHKVRIGGKFTGTTLKIAYDAVVDGVYRKSSVYAAKSVHHQKNKKLDVETFLSMTKGDFVDTEMLVAPAYDIAANQGEGVETVGALELRLHITRQLGVTHELKGIKTFHDTGSNSEDDEEPRKVNYKLVPPTLQMEFDDNSATLDKARVNREKRRMAERRPGTGPWAIFRFYYRSQEALTDHKMIQTYDPFSKGKDKTTPQTLMLDPLPPLPMGPAPHKDDDETSTRASTPMTPDLPLTPVKGSEKDALLKSPTSSKKLPPRPTTAVTPKPKMTSIIETGPIPATEIASTPNNPESVAEILRARVFSTDSPLLSNTLVSTSTDGKKAANGDTDNMTTKKTINRNANQENGSQKNKTITTRPDSEKKPKEVKITDTPLDKLQEKVVEKEPATVNATISSALLKDKVNGSIGDSVAKASSPPTTAIVSTNDTSGQPSAPPTDPAKKSPQVVIAAPKKAINKPIPIVTSTPAAKKKPVAPSAPVTPTKRTAEIANSTSPEIKRAKVTIAPSTPTNLTSVSRIPPGSPSPRPMSIERKVAEQRKKLEELRQKRLETAKKQDELDKKMAPYKQRMAEELERLNREVMEEEEAAEEDEEHLKASVEMLKEFETVDEGT